MKTFKEYINEAKTSVSVKDFVKDVEKEAKSVFGSNLDYVEDVMGIGDIDIGLKSPDLKKIRQFVKQLKAKGYDARKFGYEIDKEDGDQLFVRHPQAK